MSACLFPGVDLAYWNAETFMMMGLLTANCGSTSMWFVERWGNTLLDEWQVVYEVLVIGCWRADHPSLDMSNGPCETESGLEGVRDQSVEEVEAILESRSPGVAFPRDMFCGTYVNKHNQQGRLTISLS